MSFSLWGGHFVSVSHSQIRISLLPRLSTAISLSLEWLEGLRSGYLPEAAWFLNLFLFNPRLKLRIKVHSRVQSSAFNIIIGALLYVSFIISLELLAVHRDFSSSSVLARKLPFPLFSIQCHFSHASTIWVDICVGLEIYYYYYTRSCE